MLQEEEEKARIQNDIRILTERLAQVNESLARKIATRNDFDRTIAETEGAYKKVRRESGTHILWVQGRLTVKDIGWAMAGPPGPPCCAGPGVTRIGISRQG